MARIMPLGALSRLDRVPRTMADPRRGGADLAGLATTTWARPGRRSRPTSRSGRRRRRRPGSAWSTTAARDPAPADRAHARHLARRGARASRPGTALRLPGRRAVGARAGAAVQPAEAAARPVRPGRQRRARSRTRRSSATTVDAPRARDDLDSARQGAARAWSSTTGSTGATTAPRERRWRDTVIYELHVKGMTQLHDRVPEELRGTYAGLATPGGHRLPVRPRRDRGRAAAHPPVRHRAGGRRARADELLGLQLDRLLRPARGVLLQRGPRRAGHRVQGDGQGLPRGRPRGDPRRRLQPHGRGRRRRADAELPRAGRQDLPPGPAGRPRPASRSTTPTGT